MKKEEFFALFRAKLIERGVNTNAAAKISDNFLRRLDEEDEKMIAAVADVSEVDQFTDEYIDYMRMRQKAVERQKARHDAEARQNQGGGEDQPDADFVTPQQSTVVFDKPVSPPIADAVPDEMTPNDGYEANGDEFELPPRRPNPNETLFNRQPRAAQPEGSEVPVIYSAEEDIDSEAMPAEPEDYEPEPEPTQTGKTVFIVGVIVTLPITIAFAAASGGLFLAVFAALAAMIVLSIAAIVGGVAVGAVLAFVGIIYGITQIVQGLGPIGAYEIGIGLVITGIIMFGGILLYNFAVRFLPWVIKKLAVLLGICIKGVKKLVNLARKECYKL